MLFKSVIRLNGVARNPANGFPARLLEQRFNVFEQRVDQRFMALEQRIDQRFTSFEERFSALEQRQARLEGVMETIRDALRVSPSTS